MSELKYCQGPRCHTYDTKDRKRDLKIIRGMKHADDLAFIISMAMRVQCNAKVIGLMSMAHEPCNTLVI